ncbi:leucine-rich repeat-containing protein 15-like [Centruroides sculpturatus]|uniref:leucine-rich repeat-containing protein 15-like n=1 Tax=Centruroides sculpturatus TaxID=218467 RepID=UPI000C6E8A48|nr:leucine-rich repeat-containing protein 15-like [Centruroides sculpturatus]
MRWVFFFQSLFLAVNSRQDFWQHWGNVSCPSPANSCLESKNFSSVQIFDRVLLLNCGNRTTDSRLMRCLNVKNVQEITFTDCYLSEIDFRIFIFGYAIERVQILYETNRHKRNFESATFNNVSSLRSVEIRHVRTSELLNVTFRNVSSLTSLKIKYYNFTLFSNKPFRELINLSELYITSGELKVLPEDLFYNLCNLTTLDLRDNKIESIHPLVFRNLIKLKYLKLQSNKIKDLPGDVLKGLSNLSTFRIHRNYQLSEIPSGFFKKLKKLTEINAASCSISSLKDDVFSDLINLKDVNLGSNRIVHLPLNLLRNNKRLTRISFWDNKISTIPAEIFHGLSELRVLGQEHTCVKLCGRKLNQKSAFSSVSVLRFYARTHIRKNSGRIENTTATNSTNFINFFLSYRLSIPLYLPFFLHFLCYNIENLN